MSDAPRLPFEDDPNAPESSSAPDAEHAQDVTPDFEPVPGALPSVDEEQDLSPDDDFDVSPGEVSAPDIPEPDFPAPDYSDSPPLDRSPSLPFEHTVAPPAFDAAPPDEHVAAQPLDEAQPSPPPVAPLSPEPVVPPSSPTAAPDVEKRPTWQRGALAILLIAAAGMIGYVLSTSNERPQGPDALTRSVEAAGNLRLLLRTDVPAEAREFIRDEFGWRVGVPLFDTIALTGVAIAQAAAAVEVPVFLYADEDDQNVAVFAYSYALLDQVPDRLRLTAADYEGLAEGNPAVRDTDYGEVLIWRDRDDIYVAVTDLPPDELIRGLTMAP